MEFLYYDKDIAVCIKPAFVSSENDGMPKMLEAALAERGVKCTVYPLHRLDNAVSGVMIFALNSKAAAEYSTDIAKGEGIKKEYLAVVSGTPEQPCGRYEDLLFKDSKMNKSYVVKRERKGVKKAIADYEVLGTAEGKSLVRVLLHTGRTHQIRVQFASRKMPLVGDRKYGSKENCGIALFSHRITLKDGRVFEAFPQSDYPWNMFDL